MSWTCDFGDYDYAYRERIAVSEGTIRCCESGILIPAGFPFADCRPSWWDYTDSPCEYPDELPTDELLPHLQLRPQCIEVWRLIRNDSAKRGICPSWTDAVEQYGDHAWDTQEDKLAYVHLLGTIKKTGERYCGGKPPRLHPHEKDSLASGEFVEALPFSLKPRAKVEAE